jgi:hypothetical protein
VGTADGGGPAGAAGTDPTGGSWRAGPPTTAPDATVVLAMSARVAAPVAWSRATNSATVGLATGGPRKESGQPIYPDRGISQLLHGGFPRIEVNHPSGEHLG